MTASILDAMLTASKRQGKNKGILPPLKDFLEGKMQPVLTLHWLELHDHT